MRRCGGRVDLRRLAQRRGDAAVRSAPRDRSFSSQASTRSVTTLATDRAGEQARHGSAFVE